MNSKKDKIINEIKRIASKLGKDYISQREFESNSQINSSVIYYNFGSWNRAVEAAGLKQYTGYVPGGEAISEDDLLQEIIRLTRELGKVPSDREMVAFGKYSAAPYRRVWGKYTKGREAAYQKFGFPELNNQPRKLKSKHKESSSKPLEILELKPKKQKRKKVQFGEPIAFRGLRFAPINEQGVVYLFGMVSRELGFLIESVRTEYPDCEGKRCVDEAKNRWEHVLIEFEYKSSNFRQHGHNPDDCDLIVCWIHDWKNCPIEVLELKSTIKFLQNK